METPKKAIKLATIPSTNKMVSNRASFGDNPLRTSQPSKGLTLITIMRERKNALRREEADCIPATTITKLAAPKRNRKMGENLVFGDIMLMVWG
jgi:hypothetical protein